VVSRGGLGYFLSKLSTSEFCIPYGSFVEKDTTLTTTPHRENRHGESFGPRPDGEPDFGGYIVTSQRKRTVMPRKSRGSA
jgi:hypothetical protein